MISKLILGPQREEEEEETKLDSLRVKEWHWQEEMVAKIKNTYLSKAELSMMECSYHLYGWLLHAGLCACPRISPGLNYVQVLFALFCFVGWFHAYLKYCTLFLFSFSFLSFLLSIVWCQHVLSICVGESFSKHKHKVVTLVFFLLIWKSGHCCFWIISFKHEVCLCSNFMHDLSHSSSLEVQCYQWWWLWMGSTGL